MKKAIIRKEDFTDRSKVNDFTRDMLSIVMGDDIMGILAITMVDSYVMTLAASDEEVSEYVRDSGTFLNEDAGFRKMVELRCKMFDMINTGAESITITQDEKEIALIS